MKTRRLLKVALASVALVPALAACSSEKTGFDEVQEAIDASRLEPARFVYTVSTPEDGSFQVQGLVEDDFRYKARLFRGEEAVFDEVVRDDAIAVRFIAPSLLGAFIDNEQRDRAELDTDLRGVNVVDALSAKRWVLDPAGAPSPTDPSRAVRNIGKDPVFDALGLFAYVEQAMNEAEEVHRWSSDDLNPAYRASEDVFPRPDEDSGVERFDLRREGLPPIAVTTGAADDDRPATKHFRKMAIYVKDGRILRVMERVEVTGTAGDDFVDYLTEFAEQVGVPEEEIESQRRVLEGMSEKERSDTLLSTLNLILDGTGAAPVAVRTMTFDLRDIGEEGIEATLPNDVIKGSLAILLNRGEKIEASTASGSPAAPAKSPSASTGSGDESSED